MINFFDSLMALVFYERDGDMVEDTASTHLDIPWNIQRKQRHLLLGVSVPEIW